MTQEIKEVQKTQDKEDIDIDIKVLNALRATKTNELFQKMIDKEDRSPFAASLKLAMIKFKIAEPTADFFLKNLEYYKVGLNVTPQAEHVYWFPIGGVLKTTVSARGWSFLLKKYGYHMKYGLIHENDEFGGIDLINETVEHKIINLNRGKLQGIWVSIEDKEGKRKLDLSTKDEFDKAKSSSPTKDKGIWNDNYNEMCLKTAIRRASKYIALIPELEKIKELENDTDWDIEGKAEEVKPNNLIPKEPKKLNSTALLEGMEEPTKPTKVAVAEAEPEEIEMPF